MQIISLVFFHLLVFFSIRIVFVRFVHRHQCRDVLVLKTHIDYQLRVLVELKPNWMQRKTLKRGKKTNKSKTTTIINNTIGALTPNIKKIMCVRYLCVCMWASQMAIHTTLLCEWTDPMELESIKTKLNIFIFYSPYHLTIKTEKKNKLPLACFIIVCVFKKNVIAVRCCIAFGFINRKKTS